MKLTILETGHVPEQYRPRFGNYPDMFRRMFDGTGRGFTYDSVAVADGEPLPDPASVEAIVITGSPAGVYEDHAWLEPLRDFIRTAYAAGTPMVGICFGHQIMADALGGAVRKSEKGWGLGRHQYRLSSRPDFAEKLPELVSVVCSHQDQVIEPPPEADVLLSSEFAPNAGLLYRNGAALSFQPHPEFDDDYAGALIDLRRGQASEEALAAAHRSLGQPSHSRDLAVAIARFLTER